jgi:hypothetical protein
VSVNVDHFVPVPLRFFEALTAGDLDSAHLMVGVLIAHRCYEVKNTAAGVATVRLTTLADLCGVSDDTIERKLDGLRASGWIDFERPKQGQRIGWRIWLRGLSLDGGADTTSAPPPHDLRTTSAQNPLRCGSQPPQRYEPPTVHSLMASGIETPRHFRKLKRRIRQTRRDETKRENPSLTRS